MIKILLLLSFVTFGAQAQSVMLQCTNFTMTENATVNSTASTLILSANRFRRCLTIQNKSTTVTMYITFAAGGGATEGIGIPAGGNWDQNIANANAIYARSASGSSQTIAVMSGE